MARGDEKFLQLVTEEHKLIREEHAVREALAAVEGKERDRFTLLSTSLRDSHEKERIQMEKTKYWSITASLIGAGLGVLVSTVNNYRRTADLRTALGEVTRLESNLREHSQNLSDNSTDLAQLLTEVRALRTEQTAAKRAAVQERIVFQRVPETEGEGGEEEVLDDASVPWRGFAVGAVVGLTVGLIPVFFPR